MKRISVSITTRTAHSDSRPRPMLRSTTSSSAAPIAAWTLPLRSTSTATSGLDCAGELVEFAVVALGVLEERRVPAVVVPGNPCTSDGGSGHFRGERQYQRVV